MTPEPLKTGPSPFRPSALFVDPRTRSDFQPEHWPLCNGHEAPPFAAADLHQQRCLEFLAAYYEVNCRHDALRTARAMEPGAPEIQRHLDLVAAALEEVDALEDRYAAIGFYGEPVMEGFFYRSIHFHRPELPRLSSPSVMISSHLAIPGLDEIPVEELRGPIVDERLSDAKVDL
jgi:hypothetical protein